MKSKFSESYYFAAWDDMMKRYEKDANLEKKLERAMTAYANLPDAAFKVVEKVEAERIARECKDDMLQKMAMIKEVESGKASLGYTTKRQEIEARGDMRMGFEFTCLSLREFKKAHGIS